MTDVSGIVGSAYMDALDIFAAASKAMMLKLNKKVLAVIQEGDGVSKADRDSQIRRRLDELQKELIGR